MKLFKKVFGLLTGAFLFVFDCVDTKEPQGEERNMDSRFSDEPNNVHNQYNPQNPQSVHLNPYYLDD